MSTGSMLVETLSGTIYLVEIEADESLWVTRVTDPDRPAWSERLRRDGERLRLWAADTPVLGKPWRLYLDVRQDGATTCRFTTPVVAIREAQENESTPMTIQAEADDEDGEHGPH